LRDEQSETFSFYAANTEACFQGYADNKTGCYS